MPRIDLEDADKYASGNKGGFFSLADDGDKAIVRLYHKDIKDIDVIPVHKVDIDGRNRSVECLRSPDESKSKCPFCDADLGVSVRLFLRILEYKPDKDGYYTLNPECKIWERGSGFRKKLQGIVNRYGKNGLMNKVFEIVRMGKKGDKNTQYEIFPVDDLDEDECPIPDHDDMNFSDVLGGIVASKSFEDMEYYLDNEEFPKQEEKPKRQSRRDEDTPEVDRFERRDRNRNNESEKSTADDLEEDDAPFDTEEELPKGRRRTNVSEEPKQDTSNATSRRRRI